MTLRFARLWLCGTLLGAVPLAWAQVPAPGTTKPVGSFTAVQSKTDENVVDSFKVSDVDIDAILSALELYTGKTVIRPGQLPAATYSLRINRPIPKPELVEALESLLTLNGVAVLPMGNRFLKVVALSQAKSEAPEMINGSTLDLPPSGKIVTKVFELNFLRVSEFVPQILTFMSPQVGSGVVSLEKSNVVLVTDTLENIQKVERLLLEVDQPRKDSLTPRFYQLHNGAKATDVVTKIHTVLSGPAQNQLRLTTTVTADDRTGQVIVIADPREYPLFDALISKLDLVAEPTTSNEVIFLKHADAKDVMTLLSALIQGQNAAVQKSSSQSVRPGQILTPGQPPAPGQPPGVQVPGTQVPGSLEALSPATTEFSTYITVQADERTNSVVVSGTFNDVRLIKDIVAKIDVLLAQVSIQVVIAEVTLSDSDDSGINALNLTIGQNSKGGTAITQFAGAISGWNVTSGIVNPVSFVAAINSAGDKHKVKILEQNTVLTTHNKQAKFQVTEQEPVITGTTGVPLASTTTSNSFATSSTVSYKDIGITLTVTPLIGDDGGIQLNVD
jgi:general secretion pathway protein D